MKAGPVDDHRYRSAPRGFTLVELLVVVAIVGALVGLLLPAIQAAREAARRTACENHLRQLGLALVNYADLDESFPAGCEGCGSFPPGRLTAWNTRLLPYLERQALADAYDFTLPAWSPPNRARAILIPEFLCPSEPSARRLETNNKNWLDCAFTDYGGIFGLEGAAAGGAAGIDEANLGVFVYDTPVRLREITDGLSHTIAVAESLERRVSSTVWTNGNNVFAHGIATPVNQGSATGGDVGSPHPGGALAVRCDGGIQFLADTTEQTILNAWLTRAGGER